MFRSGHAVFTGCAGGPYAGDRRHCEDGLFCVSRTNRTDEAERTIASRSEEEVATAVPKRR